MRFRVVRVVKVVRVRAATVGLEVGRLWCFMGQEQPLENKIWVKYKQCLIHHQKPPSLLDHDQDGSEGGHMLNEQRRAPTSE